MSTERAAARTATQTGAPLGHPRVHLRRTASTNDRARELAAAGAPNGTLVTAAEQTAGRGRQGRAWVAPSGSALLASLVLRDPPALLSLVAAVAVCDAVGDLLDGEEVVIKWPNDILLAGESTVDGPHDEARPDAQTLAKLAGILVEGRPQEGWAVLGIGINVAVRTDQLPAELRANAASLHRKPSEIEPLLVELLGALELRLSEPRQTVLSAWRARDALLGQVVSWEGGQGIAQGINDDGRLLVRQPDGTVRALDAGEVHLMPAS